MSRGFADRLCSFGAQQLKENPSAPIIPPATRPLQVLSLSQTLVHVGFCGAFVGRAE